MSKKQPPADEVEQAQAEQQGAGQTESTAAEQAQSEQTNSAPVEIRVAYHDGPAAISFAGRSWQRGIAQPVTDDELAGMTKRAGWSLFGFGRAE